jgi:hypothetical protein
LVGQYLDITGLPDGRYRLRVTADGNSADGSDRFLDSDETNNPTWADLQITGDTVTVLEYGPSARRSAKEHTTDVVGVISDQGPKSNHLGPGGFTVLGQDYMLHTRLPGGFLVLGRIESPVASQEERRLPETLLMRPQTPGSSERVPSRSGRVLHSD